jgi:hypothetical protein
MFKEALFSQSRICRFEPVETEAGTTYVKELTVAEKDAFDQATSGGKENVRAQLLIACVCDQAGEPEFTEFDVGAINRLPAYIAEPIIDAAMRINRFSAEDREALQKNSSSGRNGSSSSGSLSASAAP